MAFYVPRCTSSSQLSRRINQKMEIIFFPLETMGESFSPYKVQLSSSAASFPCYPLHVSGKNQRA